MIGQAALTQTSAVSRERSLILETVTFPTQKWSAFFSIKEQLPFLSKRQMARPSMLGSTESLVHKSQGFTLIFLSSLSSLTRTYKRKLESTVRQSRLGWLLWLYFCSHLASFSLQRIEQIEDWKIGTLWSKYVQSFLVVPSIRSRPVSLVCFFNYVEPHFKIHSLICIGLFSVDFLKIIRLLLLHLSISSYYKGDFYYFVERHQQFCWSVCK